MALISGVRDCMCLRCVCALLDGDASDKNFCLFGVFFVFVGTLLFGNNTLHLTLMVFVCVGFRCRNRIII